MATINDFEKLDIRVGEITKVEDFPEAHTPAYKLTIDFGKDFGTKCSSARITENYTKEELKGQQVLAVVNFPPRRVGPFTSEVLVLGVPDENGNVVLITAMQPVPKGGKLY